MKTADGKIILNLTVTHYIGLFLSDLYCLSLLAIVVCVGAVAESAIVIVISQLTGSDDTGQNKDALFMTV